MFDAVAAAGVSTLVHASSVGAYSPGQDATPVDESWPTHALPTAAYGREKSYVERVLDTFEVRHPNCRVVRLRPGFIFKREAAPEQRRLFAGPLHSEDAAAAYRLAVLRDVRGAFNVAADPVLDPAVLGDLLGARPVPVPKAAARAVMAAAWHLHPEAGGRAREVASGVGERP